MSRKFTAASIGMTDGDLAVRIYQLGTKAVHLATRVSEKTLVRWFREYQKNLKDFPITLPGDPGYEKAKQEMVRRLLRRNPRRASRGRTRRVSRKPRALSRKQVRRNPRGISERKQWEEVRQIGLDLLERKIKPSKIGYTGNQLAGLATMMLAQLNAGIHENPALAVLGNPGVAGTIAKEVYEIRYRHAQDGKNYKHSFGPGVRATLLTDGRAVIWHPSKPVWQEL